MSGDGAAGEGTLLFVYAADGGLFNTVSDIAHKLFSPQTYACRLCALTHGHFRVREEWKAFIASLPVSCQFLHRDEARAMPGVDVERLPAVYRRQGDCWTPCLSPERIAECADLRQLQVAIREACVGADDAR